MVDLSYANKPDRNATSVDKLSEQASALKEVRSLILMESDLSYLPDRAAQLTEADYRVTTIRDIRELFPLSRRSNFTIALISELLGVESLEAAARMVRMEWPDARILVLGGSERMLDDHLYDERIDAFCAPCELLRMLATLDQNKRGGRPYIVPSITESERQNTSVPLTSWHGAVRSS